MLATEYAKYYKIAPQRKNETDAAFRSRVSAALRDRGYITEAHEAYRDERYEDSSDVITGIMGAMTQVLLKKNYGSHGERQIGDDIAVGIVTQSPKLEMNPATAILMIELFG
jgi:hypothetical protein